MDDRDSITPWGRWLMQLVKARGLTMQEFATRLGAALDYISYLSRLALPAPDLRRTLGPKLCEVLQTDYKILLGEYRWRKPSEVPAILPVTEQSTSDPDEAMEPPPSEIEQAGAPGRQAQTDTAESVTNRSDLAGKDSCRRTRAGRR
jgi:hypothetical protein